MCYSIIAVKYPGDLLKRRPLCFDVEDPNEGKLYHIPERVEEHEVPMFGEVVPGNFVRLATEYVSKNVTRKQGGRRGVQGEKLTLT